MCNNLFPGNISLFGLLGGEGMEQKRKQRLVGGLVLIAAAVILYPLFFGRNMPNEELAVVIPEPPPAMDVPDTIGVLNEPMVVPEDPADFELPPAAGDSKPTLDKQGIPVSWTLQLAAFSKQENAWQLQDKLRDSGYRTYTREGTSGSGKTLYRVYVGPELRKEKLLKLRKEIDQQLKLKGIAVRFRP